MTHIHRLHRHVTAVTTQHTHMQMKHCTSTTDFIFVNTGRAKSSSSQTILLLANFLTTVDSYSTRVYKQVIHSLSCKYGNFYYIYYRTVKSYAAFSHGIIAVLTLSRCYLN